MTNLFDFDADGFVTGVTKNPPDDPPRVGEGGGVARGAAAGPGARQVELRDGDRIRPKHTLSRHPVPAEFDVGPKTSDGACGCQRRERSEPDVVRSSGYRVFLVSWLRGSGCPVMVDVGMRLTWWVI